MLGSQDLLRKLADVFILPSGFMGYRPARHRCVGFNGKSYRVNCRHQSPVSELESGSNVDYGLCMDTVLRLPV